MHHSTFTYTSYVRSTPETLWHALTDVEIIKQWWFGVICESDWRLGSSWKMMSAQGMVYDSGEVIECVPQKKLAFNWVNQWMPEFKAEGVSICSYEMEQAGSAVKLTVTHSIAHEHSKFLESISQAWPMTLSNLKSLLETGEGALTNNPRHAD